MDRLPTGCLLIDTEVFANVKEPWFEFIGEHEGEDYSFCRKAIDAGFNIWCDIPLSLQLGHLGVHAVWTNQEYPDDSTRPPSQSNNTTGNSASAAVKGPALDGA
jgi:hypothetical protein